MTPRPIETAPKDRTRILVYTVPNQEWVTATWSGSQEKWCDDEMYVVFPTHWLPLPPAP